MNLNEIHPMQKATELRLLAAAIELQHLTGMASNMVPIPGGDRVIAVGAPADVLRLLEVTSAAQPVAASAGIEGLRRYAPRQHSQSPTGATMESSDDGYFLHVDDVRALLATQSAKQGAQPSAFAVPDGWTLVPSTLTPEMKVAGGNSNSEWLNDNAPIGEARYAMPMESVWAAMLAASPAAPLQTMDDTTRDESATDDAMKRACRDLPEFYQVHVELENGCGCVVWYDQFGASHSIEGEGFLSDDINKAVECAIEDAAMKSSPASTDQKGSGHE